MSCRGMIGVFVACAALLTVGDVARAQEAETCDLAGFIIDDLGAGDAILTGSTAFTANDYTYGAACGGYSSSSGQGGDLVYSLETAANCEVTVSLVSTQLPTTNDTALWVVTDCSDPVGGCVGGDDAFGVPESVTFMATAGTQYFIVVDAYGTTNDGPYELTVSGPTCGTTVPVTLQSFEVQ